MQEEKLPKWWWNGSVQIWGHEFILLLVPPTPACLMWTLSVQTRQRGLFRAESMTLNWEWKLSAEEILNIKSVNLFSNQYNDVLWVIISTLKIQMWYGNWYKVILLMYTNATKLNLNIFYGNTLQTFIHIMVWIQPSVSKHETTVALLMLVVDKWDYLLLLCCHFALMPV